MVKGVTKVSSVEGLGVEALSVASEGPCSVTSFSFTTGMACLFKG